MAEENSVSPRRPSVVFLGLCERATYVREGNTNLFKWNILGLKTVILSYIYPLKVEHLAIGLAFPAAIVVGETKFRIANTGGEEVGTLSLTASTARPTEEDLILQKDVPNLLIPKDGWTAAFLPLAATGLVINKPGVYFLEQLRRINRVRLFLFKYFESIRTRPDRAIIKDEWIRRTVESPMHEKVQTDGRIRRWTRIQEMEGRRKKAVRPQLIPSFAWTMLNALESRCE